MVVLVNASVYDRCCSQTVLSWTIFDVGDDSLSLSDFYRRIIRDHDCLPEEHELQEARVGRSKENLDSVNDLGEDSFYSCKYSILKCAGCVCGGGGGGGEIFKWNSPQIIQIIQIIHTGLQTVAVTSFGNFLCASKTAPHHSFRNPAERVMSVLNLGMQSVGLARRQLEEEVETKILRCTTMSQVRELALKDPSIKESLLDSVSPVKVTLADIAQRLELKGKKFSVGAAASEAEISDLWSQLKEIDPEFDLCPTDKIPRKKVTQNLQAFLKHCCRERHYFFDIKKCGNAACTICKPPRLPSDLFSKL